MLTLFYSPHATSIDNEALRASGHADVPLSVRGQQQARELGHHYASTALAAVFCSDLQRASATGAIAFSGREVSLVLDARLRECDYGELTQCSVAQIDAEFPRRVTDPFPGGESLLMVTQRVGAFLRDVVGAHDGKPIAVIGHRVTKLALDYWGGDATLEAFARTPREWRDVPIWRYELQPRDLVRHALAG